MSIDLISSPHQGNYTIFLSGPAGSGKTTIAVRRLRHLLEQGTPAEQILVLVPQRTLSRSYYDALFDGESPPGARPRITTFASLARQSVELYWPLIADRSTAGDAAREPTFLTLETSQYHMARFVDAAIDRGEFDGIRIERSRVISQVLDNLNKAALYGFKIDTAYRRLELAIPSGEQRTARINALNAARRISHFSVSSSK